MKKPPQIIMMLFQNLQQTAKQLSELCGNCDISPKLAYCLFGVLWAYMTCVFYLAFAGPVPSLFYPFLVLTLVFVLLVKGFRLTWSFASLNDCALQLPSPPAAWKVGSSIALFYVLYTVFCGIWNNGDTTWQWQQVQEGRFHDWHPVIHTVILWLIARLWNSQEFVVAVQCIVFGTLCGWLYATMLKYGYRIKLAFFTILFIAISPGAQEAMRILWKDTAFALAGLALCIILMHLWHTNGNWLLKPLNMLGFFLTILLVSFLRHNGIFLTVPLVLLLPLLFQGVRRRLQAVLLSFLCLLMIAGYIQARNKLIQERIIDTDSGQQYFEAIGVPLTILGANMLRAPDKIPPDIKLILLEMGDENAWHLYYRGDGFHDGENTLGALKDHLLFKEVLTKHCDLAGFLKLFARVVIHSPVTSVKAFVNLTSIAWNPISHTRFLVANRNPGYPLDFLLSGLRADLINPPIGWFFIVPGMHLAFLLYAGIQATLRHGWKSTILFLPFFAYAFGTAFLLFSNCEAWRYYYIICICSVPLMDIMFCPKVNSIPKQQKRK